MQVLDLAPKPYYSDEAVTIYHGDCREIMPLLGKVDLVLTDPPYGLNFAKWDAAIPDWLPAARASAPVVAFTTAPTTMWAYPRPSWVAAYSRQGATTRNAFGGFCHWTPVLIYGDARLPVDFAVSNDALAHIAVAREHNEHPSPKPIPIFRWLIESLGAQTILDPFMGSGTTLRAAKDLGRKAIGIEIEERYCEIAAKRMSQLVMAL